MGVANSPERQSPDAYPFSVEIPTRFGDMDTLGHLNNAALASLYEDARVRFFTALDFHGLWEPGCRQVVGEVTIRYLLEGHYPTPLTAYAGVLRLGTSSFTVGLAMFQAGKCIGLCDTVLVYVDAQAGRSRPLPNAFRAALAERMLRD